MEGQVASISTGITIHHVYAFGLDYNRAKECDW